MKSLSYGHNMIDSLTFVAEVLDFQAHKGLRTKNLECSVDSKHFQLWGLEKFLPGAWDIAKWYKHLTDKVQGHEFNS